MTNRYSARQKARQVKAPVRPVQVIYSGSGFVVQNLVGLHIHTLPAPGVPIQPTLGLGLIRTHDNALGWRNVQSSSGAVFDWTVADNYMDTHYSLGRRVIWTLNQTPTWAARDLANDVYGYSGGGSPPLNVDGFGLYSDLTNFIAALVTRYNTDLVRDNGGAKKLVAIETGNEPTYEIGTISAVDTAGNTVTFTGLAALPVNSKVFVRLNGAGGLPAPLALNTTYYTRIASTTTTLALTSGGAAIDLTTTGSGTIEIVPVVGNFWWGTPAEQVTQIRTTRLAAKAVDPTISVIGPGIIYNPGPLGSYTGSGVEMTLSASDGVGGTGKDWCVDGLACHPYYTRPIEQWGGVRTLQSLQEQHKFYLRMSGMSSLTPLWITEQGMYDNSAGTITDWVLAGSEKRAQTIWRLYAQAAGYGMRSLCFYDFGVWMGNGTTSLDNEPLELAAITEAHQMLDGALLTYCAVNSDGSTTITANGVTYRR